MISLNTYVIRLNDPFAVVNEALCLWFPMSQLSFQVSFSKYPFAIFDHRANIVLVIVLNKKKIFLNILRGHHTFQQ